DGRDAYAYPPPWRPGPNAVTGRLFVAPRRCGGGGDDYLLEGTGGCKAKFQSYRELQGVSASAREAGDEYEWFTYRCANEPCELQGVAESCRELEVNGGRGGGGSGRGGGPLQNRGRTRARRRGHGWRCSGCCRT